MTSITLNTSYKAHALLGAALSLWLAIFQILISPFDLADLTLFEKLIIIPPYGILFFICYLGGVYIQNWNYNKTGVWNIKKESLTLLLIYTVLLLLCFAYYKTPHVQGEYSFFYFTFFVFIPIAIVFTAFIVLGRIYLNKLVIKRTKDKILLKGVNKGDVLQVKPDEIVCISSAQNYVEVFFLKEGILQKKVLRNTLKKINDLVPQLLQVHRSHFVHPEHFVKWKNQTTAIFHTLEIPISKTYLSSFKETIRNQ